MRDVKVVCTHTHTHTMIHTVLGRARALPVARCAFRALALQRVHACVDAAHQLQVAAYGFVSEWVRENARESESERERKNERAKERERRARERGSE